MQKKNRTGIDIIFEPGRILTYILWSIGFLTIVHIIGQFSIYHLGVNQHSNFFIRLFVNAFNLDSERSIPSLFVVVEWLFCLALLSLIVFYKKKDKSPYLYWQGLAIIFIYLTIDEFVAIHEFMMIPVRQLLNTSGIFYYAWVIPYSVGVVIFLLVYVKFVFSLPARTRNLFIIAGTIFVSSAIGIELIESWSTFTQGDKGPYFHYLFFVTIEEPLEMIGLALFIYALISYIITELGPLQIRIGHDHRKTAIKAQTKNPKKHAKSRR